MKCFFVAGKKPFERENLRFVESYADYGNAHCKAALGKMYEEGYGVDQDFDKARALFVEAAALEPGLNILLGKMAELGEGEPVDYVKARNLYQRSGKLAALQLGRFMVQGKGGPQDIPGALSLYLDVARSVGDEPWTEMERLRKEGHALNEAQATHYRQIWLNGFRKELHRRLLVREVFEAVNAGGEARKARLTFRFTQDSAQPQVTLTQGSGYANLDAQLMQAIGRFKLGTSAPLINETGKLDIVAPLVFEVRDIPAGTWGICGRKPCD
ncbi:tetratricopeptide repeat protein [Pseudomonas asplenii]|uniref:tetratricopeptide repeat protein n=1 Tax=Pseudomonas asplenii TaxID=53407 RepID=UPI0037C8F2C8